MNIKQTITKLQKALLHRGHIYKINTYQFLITWKLWKIKYDNQSDYGFGGRYTQFTRAKERREKHLEEREALKTAQGDLVILDDVSMYAYYCPRCQLKVLLTAAQGEKVYCPVCETPIYRSGKCEVMRVERGSRRALLERGGEVALDSDGRMRE